MLSKIYLDNNASTCIAPEVLQAVYQALQQSTGNPSSLHAFGRQTRHLLLQAKDQIAAFLQVQPQELIFTSGATEATNMLLHSFFSLHPNAHLITTDVEHAALFETAQYWARQGRNITFLKVGLTGAPTPEAIKVAIQPETKLIALMAANNETGVKTDVAAIAAIAQEAGIPLFIDAVAWIGKEEWVLLPGVTALCFSGHKIHAPQGIGCLFIRKGFKMVPLLLGGVQQYNLRGGTENVAGAVGLGAAVKLLAQELPAATQRMESLRNHFEQELLHQIPGCRVNGEGARICNTSNLYFPGIEGESLLKVLDLEGIAASHGSACSSGSLEPSRILLNMGYPYREALSSLRFSLSRFTQKEEIDEAVKKICQALSFLSS